MSEYEIVYLASEYLNRTWDVMQFWASVSFGLIALSHLGARHLNILIASLVSLLYIGFTLFVMNMLRVNGAVVTGFLTQLKDLPEAGTPLGAGALAIISTAPNPLQMAAIVLAFFGLFLGSLVFLWFSVLRARKAAQAT